MGFFGALGKVLAGKPVYTPQDEAAKQNSAQVEQPVQPGAAPVAPDSQSKEIPQLHCGRIESQSTAGRCNLYVDVMNQSHEMILLDNVQLLGMQRGLERQLRPGESHQVLLYSGPTLMNEPSGYAIFRYRIQADHDYFRAQFHMHFVHESDGSYRITELRTAGHIKDLA